MTPNAILEFILNLLRDPQAAASYCANPCQALTVAGLDVTPEDISAVAPMVAESALVSGGSQLQAIVAAGAAAGTTAALASTATAAAAVTAATATDA
ncbi:IniB N-terminal domain-containing protein, partial [Nocardia sp. NPDC004823]